MIQSKEELFSLTKPQADTLFKNNTLNGIKLINNHNVE